MNADEPRASLRVPAAVPELFESKLHPPNARPTLVARDTLVDRLVETRHVPIASIVAPPGYGKTTLLAQWTRRDPARVVWLSLDRHDNELGQLLSYTAAALDRVVPVDPDLLKPPTRRYSVAAAASRVAGALSGAKEPLILVFDHVEQLENHECRDTVAELALHLPEGVRLALATRSEPPLPVPRLRATGDMVEIGADDLAMDRSDARALLEAEGVDLREGEMEEVIDRAEGWPVGLYLAALALKSGGASERAGVPFSGDDRLMAEYLRAEILDRLTTEEVSFLTRTAVLDRMTGRLCDAVLDDSGSARVLDSLARSNLLLIALDRTGEWFRYHHLFHDLLRAELQRREPELVPALHRRAADWYEEHGAPQLAIDHAQAANDVDHVNRLVLVNAGAAYAGGRIHTVERWLSWFDDRGLVDRYPAIAVTGAVIFSASGRISETERWEAAAERVADAAASGTPADQASLDEILPDGNTLASWFASLRLSLCRDGLDGMRRDVEIASAGLGARSGYRAAILVYEALIYLFDGDTDRADAILAHALDVAADTGRPPAALVASATRGFIAANRNDWSGAITFSEGALEDHRHLRSPRQPRERARLCTGRAHRAPRTRHCCRAGVHDPSRAPPSHPHRLPPARFTPSAARAGPQLRGPRRRGRCPGDPPPSPGDPSPATQPRAPARAGGRARSEDRDHPRGTDRSVVAHHGRAPAPPAAADAPHVSADRRAAPRLPPYRENPGDVDVPKARRLLAR